MSDAATDDGRTFRAEPETFRARGMSASLTVDDLQESLRWYRDVVGFVVDREIEIDGTLRGIVLVAGNVRLIINQDDGAKGWDRQKGEGFSLTFVTAQSVDDVANRIKECGGTLESEPADMHWGARIFRVVDPNGFKLTISSM